MNDSFIAALNLSPEDQATLKDDITKASTGAVDDLINLGQNLHYEANFEAAIQCYNKAIEMDPSKVSAYNLLGVTFFELNRMDNTFQVLNTAISLDPKAPKAYISLGSLMINQSRSEEAMKLINQAIEIDPSHAESYFGKVTLVNRDGNKTEIERMVTEIMSLSDFYGNFSKSLGVDLIECFFDPISASGLR